MLSDLRIVIRTPKAGCYRGMAVLQIIGRLKGINKNSRNMREFLFYLFAHSEALVHCGL